MKTSQYNSVGLRFSAAASGYTEVADVQRIVSGKTVVMLEQLPAPARILEIGCGTGLLTRLLLKQFPSAQICAIDIAEKMVERACREVPGNGRVRWEVADARTFHSAVPFPLITSSSSLHWITPIKEVLENIAGIATKGGYLVFAMMLDGSLAELHKARLIAAPGKPPGNRLPRKSEVLDALSAAGFDVEIKKQETVTITYPNANGLLKAIHGQGVTGGDVSTARLPLTRVEIEKLLSYYEANYAAPAGGVISSYQILYVQARCRQ